MWSLLLASPSFLTGPAAAPARLPAGAELLRPALFAPRLAAPPLAIASPGVREAKAVFYEGRDRQRSRPRLPRDIGTRKVVVVTGASSGLGLSCMKALLNNYEGYYVIAAVRDTEKMASVAETEGFSTDDYAVMKLELASFQSVKDFVQDLKNVLPRGRGLDRLVCNAAVYLPTDPKPRFTDDGYELSLGINHLGHFLLLQLLLPKLQKAKNARVCVVGSVTGNKNTVAGSLVKPVADVGELAGLKSGAGQVMVDGAAKFDGAKAYKDAKALNMMTVLEAHRRLHDKTGVTFCSMYPGCVATTSLFREKREWFRYFFFPTLMKAIGSYVSQGEAGERLAQVLDDEVCTKSGVYWSWNGNAQYIGVGNAGGSGGEIFENSFSGMVSDARLNELCWEYSMDAVKAYL